MIEFNGLLYNSTDQAYHACASEWLSAGGMNNQDYILEILKLYTDKDLAQGCIEDWNISEKDWFNMEELVDAFAKLRDEAFGGPND